MESKQRDEKTSSFLENLTLLDFNQISQLFYQEAEVAFVYLGETLIWQNNVINQLASTSVE